MKAVVVVMLFVVVGLGGCMGPAGGPAQNSRVINSVESDGLVVTIELPKRVFAVGEEFAVGVTARNITSRPIIINSASGAPIYARLLRHTGLNWEQVKRYPKTETMLMNAWRIEPGSQRSFVLTLTVEPDWPTGELLRLTAEVNGISDLSAGVALQIAPATRNGK